VSEALVAGLLAGYGVAVPVGAIAILIIGLTASTSLRVGVGAALGVATADGLYAFVAVLGGAALAGLIEPISEPLRWVAAAVLVALAVRTAVTAVRQHREPAATPPRSRSGLGTPARAYFGLLGLTLLNPMTIVYFSALVLGRQAFDRPEWGGGVTSWHSGAEEAVFVTAAFAASASWQLVIAGSGSLVGRMFTGARGRLITALASSVVIVILAAHLLALG
jgi:arginine exporter protein ArgO